MCLGLNGSCFLDNKHIMCFLIRFAYELCTGPCQRSQLTRFLKHYEFRRAYLPFWQGRDHIGGLAEEHEPSPVLVKLLKLQFFSPAFTVCEVHTTLISHQHNFITFLVIHLDILQWKKAGWYSWNSVWPVRLHRDLSWKNLGEKTSCLFHVIFFYRIICYRK